MRDKTTRAKRPIPFNALADKLRKAGDQKMCLHPNAGAGVCDQVISAHSIQRSSVLERIVDSSNHVLSFYPPSLDADGRLKIQPVGWREASTFTGFCAKHDNLVFQPLERKEFVGTEQQTFLAGYRALCHELFQKSASLRSGRVMDDFLHVGRADQIQALAIRIHDSFNAGVEAGLEQLREYKRSADQHLLNEEYSALSSTVITFSGELCIASTGAVSLHQDFTGAQLQRLQDLEERIQGLFCTTLTTKDGGAVVFSWPKTTSAGSEFVSSLIAKSGDDLPSFLVQFFFMFVENTYFSPSWWKLLSDLQRRQLEYLANRNPHVGGISFTRSRFVPWKIIEVKTISS